MRVDWNAGDAAAWPWTRELYDGIGRKYQEQSGRSGARTVYRSWDFDDEARPSAESLPYFATDTPVRATISYDLYGRPSRVRQQDGVGIVTVRDIVIEDGRPLNTVVDTHAAGTAEESVTRAFLDTRGRVVRKEYPLVDAGGAPSVVTYEYDLFDRVMDVN